MIGRPPASWIRECLPIYIGEVLCTNEIIAITGKDKRTVSHSMNKYFGKQGFLGVEMRFQARWMIHLEGMRAAGYTGPDLSDPHLKDLQKTLQEYGKVKASSWSVG